MKKYIKYSIGLIIGTFLIVSCEDVMDTKPKSSFNDAAVWGSEASADAFAIDVYRQAISYLYGGSADWESATPNGSRVSQVGEGINHLATELGLSSNTNYGFNRFSRLRACNVLIQKASEANLPEPVKNRLIAEGKFLRGCIFFDQARKMGRFVPILEVLNPEDSLKFKTNATKNVVESYEIVMKDLTDAAYGMTETSQAGRANKYAAHLIRSRAALQAYAYTGNKAYLDTCVVSSNAIIESGKYSLTSNYGGLFNHESPTNNEIILARYFLAEDFTVVQSAEMQLTFANINADDNKVSLAEPQLKYPNGKFFHGWGIYWPTQDLVDQYLVIDEATKEALPWDQTSQFKNNIEKLNPSAITTVGAIDSYTRTNGESRSIPSTQDLRTGRTDYPLFREHLKVKTGSPKNVSEIMYENRDKRFYATVLHDKSTFFGEHLTMNLNGNFAQGVRDKEDGGWYVTATGYYWRKGIYENLSLASASTKTNYHYVIARLGEAFLNLAEAKLLQGKIPEAVAVMNKTRVTHGELPPSTASTEAEAWADYIRERRVEMAEENGDIYFSYLRWGKYGGHANNGAAPGSVINDFNRPVYKIQISRDRKQALIGQLTLLDSWNRNFTTRRYLFPIPQSELDNRAIYGIYDEQNQGW